MVAYPYTLTNVDAQVCTTAKPAVQRCGPHPCSIPAILAQEHIHHHAYMCLPGRGGTSTMHLVGTAPTSVFPLHALKLGVKNT